MYSPFFQVSTHEGEELAKEFGCPFFESSAALRSNVDEIFHEVVRCIRKKEHSDYKSTIKGSKGKHISSKDNKTGGMFCCVNSPTES